MRRLRPWVLHTLRFINGILTIVGVLAFFGAAAAGGDGKLSDGSPEWCLKFALILIACMILGQINTNIIDKNTKNKK
jgi:hypothetical protein